MLNTTTGLCSCVSKRYNDGVLAICGSCHETCFNCAGTSDTQCISCNGTANRVSTFSAGSPGACVCRSGYFGTASLELCSPCPITCLTCSDASTCLTCNVNNFRTGTSTCACKPKYYENSPINAKCNACSYRCATCSNSVSCSTCSPIATTKRVDTPASMCPCDPKYFDDGASEICVACKPECATCTNANSCTSCNSVVYRELMNGQCVCMSNTYNISNTDCSTCDPTCLTCATSGTSCLTCNTTAFRQRNSASECKCIQGYYESAGTCSPCHFSCLTCTADNLAASCTSCNSSSFRTQSSSPAACTCLPGYYEVNFVQACAKCHYSCKTCLNGNECDTCDIASPVNRVATINSVTKLCDCATGFYDDGTNVGCIACDYTCTKCSGPGVCTECDSSKNRAITNTSCPCQQGYYDNQVVQCATCPSTCLSCTAAGCTSCAASNKRVLSNYSCPCVIGFFDLSSVCTVCDLTCVTCSGTYTTCTSCNASFYRALSGTQCNCLEGYYHANTQVCLKCPYSCLTCTNSTDCATCDATKGRKQVTALTGLCTCDVKTYDDGVNMLCVPCSYKCSTCNAAGCLTCHSTRVVNGSSCSCSPGKYDDGAT